MLAILLGMSVVFSAILAILVYLYIHSRPDDVSRRDPRLGRF